VCCLGGVRDELARVMKKETGGRFDRAAGAASRRDARFDKPFLCGTPRIFAHDVIASSPGMAVRRPASRRGAGRSILFEAGEGESVIVLRGERMAAVRGSPLRAPSRLAHAARRAGNAKFLVAPIPAGTYGLDGALVRRAIWGRDSMPGAWVSGRLRVIEGLVLSPSPRRRSGWQCRGDGCAMFRPPMGGRPALAPSESPTR